MSIEEANAFLAGVGGKSAKFERVGDTTKGIIVAADLRDQTDYKTGRVVTFDDGSPRKQLVITLETDEREDDDDDGVRKLYAKGAMLAAVRAASGGRLALGAKLAVRYIGDGEAQGSHNPPKQYRAFYEAPSVTVPVAGDAEDMSPF